MVVLLGVKSTENGFWYMERQAGLTLPAGYCPTHPPHETYDEAVECYRNWLLDQRLNLRARWAGNEQHPCLICGQLTPTYVQVGSVSLSLCTTHATRENTDILLKGIGEPWLGKVQSTTG